MGRGIHQGAWHNYGVQDGLPASLITHLYYDERQGALWLTSLEGGITRYDGANCHIYTTAEGLSDNTIHEIVADRQGRLWFACKRRGIIRYDGETFTSFTTEDGLAGDDTRSIYVASDGTLWIFTWRNGLSSTMARPSAFQYRQRAGQQRGHAPGRRPRRRSVVRHPEA